ncbi:MAG: arylsulfatase, partial [Acidimicrobiaceae bacterium]|nr:arylsulfatase [Acidimicrobiaceae bacterium]
LDDVGFAQLGCFGSDLSTPTFDGLAERGLRFTNFHTTALCSPTRSCILTGRNHHSNGMGRVIEIAAGYPGYNSRIPFANGFLSEMLVEAGYATFAIGKWHLTPEDEIHAGASRARWPLGRGFERFYGFMSGETHQFVPNLIHDNHYVAPPYTPEEGYHLTRDLADRAMGCIRDLRVSDPDKPFFLYFATGACHSPHQAPREWIERYRGAFDGGWDAWREATLARQVSAGVLPEGTELSPRPEWVPAWDSLSADERRLYARYMEAFAGFLSHTDHEIGRLIEFLRRTGELDNTLLCVLSDNGASSEGGQTGSMNDVRPWNVLGTPFDEALAHLEEIGGPRWHNNYPWGWTIAGNTPFRRWKREVHEGGVADPLILHWPCQVAGPDFRRQYVHAIDFVPTVLEAVGLEAPEAINGVPQRPIEGTSFFATIADPSVPAPHTRQYYEMFGCRGLYEDGWKAVTYHPIMQTEPGFDADEWELYHVDKDPSECHDLAAAEPQRLRRMIELWWIEAAKHQVLPLDPRPLPAMVGERKLSVPDRQRYIYYPGAAQVPELMAVNVKNRSHRVSATVELDDGPSEGVLISQGSLLGGWCLYLKDDALHYVHNLAATGIDRLSAPVSLDPGPHEWAFEFLKTGSQGGRARLVADGAVVAEGTIDRFTLGRFSLTGAGVTCGYSNGLPVTDDIRPPFPFTGKLDLVTVDVDGAAFIDPDEESEAVISMQ